MVDDSLLSKHRVASVRRSGSRRVIVLFTDERSSLRVVLDPPMSTGVARAIVCTVRDGVPDDFPCFVGYWAQHGHGLVCPGPMHAWAGSSRNALDSLNRRIAAALDVLDVRESGG